MTSWQQAHDLAQAAVGMAPKGSREGYWGLAAAVLAVLDLHRPVAIPNSAGLCHEASHNHAYDSGLDWWFCGDCEPQMVICSTCRNGDGEGIGHPCDTLRALGVTE